MKIIVGLGNPGIKYKNNRHNVGFMVVEEIANRQGCVFKKGFLSDGFMVKIKTEKETAILLKPSTYMNNSGICVKKIVSKNSIESCDVLVVYDDADLLPGILKLRKSGSSGGHQGMESIIEKLGTPDIPRLRVGIGKPDRQDLADYVLSDFSNHEKDEIHQAIEKAADACIDWIDSGIDYVMNNYNK